MNEKIKARAVKSATNWINVKYQNLAPDSLKLVGVAESEFLFDHDLTVQMEFKVIIGDYVQNDERHKIVKPYTLTLYVDRQGKVSRTDPPVFGKQEIQ